MASFDLLELELGAPLAYRGLENPPLAGVPLGGSVPLPDAAGALRPFALGADLAEGEEELFAFEAEGLVAFDPDEGPRLADPLPPASFYGRSAGGAACGSCSACSPAKQDKGGACSPAKQDKGGACSPASRGGGGQAEPRGPACGDAERRLPAGRYLFLQFRPESPAELAAGLEWFAREAWWEGKRGAGPYFLRRVKEDSKLATQILRRAEGR